MMSYEKFYNLGFQVFENFLDSQQIKKIRLKLRQVYKLQIEEFGIDNLLATGEENSVRSPFLYDGDFTNLFNNDKIKKIVKDILGEHAILSLQNGIISKPFNKHHQSKFHRDIIYQEFTSSRPLGVNIYYCLDDYNQASGGTQFVIKSHKKDSFESTAERMTPEAPAGSIIVFDPMVYHKAGFNQGKDDRMGINHMFTLPFIKQQIRYHSLFEKTNDADLNQLLGFNSREHDDVLSFRKYRLERIK